MVLDSLYVCELVDELAQRSSSQLAEIGQTPQELDLLIIFLPLYDAKDLVEVFLGQDSEMGVLQAPDGCYPRFLLDKGHFSKALACFQDGKLYGSG